MMGAEEGATTAYLAAGLGHATCKLDMQSNHSGGGKEERALTVQQQAVGSCALRSSDACKMHAKSMQEAA